MSVPARRTALVLLVALVFQFFMGGCEVTPSDMTNGGVTKTTINVRINTKVFAATLEDNAATEALTKVLEDGPVTLGLSDYAGFEKVGPIGRDLPAEDRQVTTAPGDIMLYQGNQIVLFYGPNTWSYTPLAHVGDLSGWESALGAGDVVLTLSLA